MKATDKPDYELAREELTALFDKLQFTVKTTSLGLDEDEENWSHYAYTLSFTRIGHGHSKAVRFDYRMGTGLKGSPKPAEVLACVCRDYYDTKGVSFEDWASNLGYELDSRKAEKVFNTCLALGGKLSTLGLNQAEIEQLAELSSRL